MRHVSASGFIRCGALALFIEVAFAISDAQVPVRSLPITDGGTLSLLTFSEDSQSLVGWDNHGVFRWDPTAVRGLERRLLKDDACRNGGWLANADDWRFAGALCSNKIVTWDARTAAPAFSAPFDQMKFNHYALSPDGKILATYGRGGGLFSLGQPATAEDKTITLWDTATLASLGTLAGHTDKIRRIGFSPDGQTLVSSGGGDILVWNVRTRQQTHAIKGDSQFDVSPDGKLLASTDNHGMVIFDLASGAEKSRPKTADYLGFVYQVAFSPDGRLLGAVKSDAVVIWDVAKGTMKRTVRDDNVQMIAFSPDGKWLATAEGSIGSIESVHLFKIGN